MLDSSWVLLDTMGDLSRILARFLNLLGKLLLVWKISLKEQPRKEWTEVANSAFKTLKELCTSTPILAYPDYQLPFILHTDSSSDGLGAVLYQKQEDILRVIAYASGSISKTESNYPAHKLEFLALKWAV